MLQNSFSLRQFRLTKWSFVVHSTTRNAPYVHPKLDSNLELCRTFPIAWSSDMRSTVLNAFYWYQIFALDSAVVEVQEMFSPHGGHLTNTMYQHGENLQTQLQLHRIKYDELQFFLSLYTSTLWLLWHLPAVRISLNYKIKNSSAATLCTDNIF